MNGKELEQIALVGVLAFIAYMVWNKPATVNSISNGGAELNGIPFFLNYNAPLALGPSLAAPTLSSGQENSPCSSCSNFMVL